jgi:prolyl oligopeptidase
MDLAMLRHLPSALLTAIVVLPLMTTTPPPLAAQSPADPFIWLEEVEAPKALEWVERQNTLTRESLRANPGYQRHYDETLAILTSADRIAMPTFRGEQIYNLWTDATNPRGLYRRTSLEAYLAGTPAWETVLDIDALSAAEDVPWVLKGVSCLKPAERFCMMSLARGGSDATVEREFDLETKQFVTNGFALPEAKVSTAWVDGDHLLVAAALPDEPTTSSGYAAAVKLWQRGTPWSSARQVFAIDTADMGVWLGSLHTARGEEPVISRMPTIFTSEQYLLRDGAMVRLDVPDDAQITTLADQMVLKLVSDWTVAGETFTAGSVVSANLEQYLAGTREIEVLLEPGERSTIDDITTTRNLLLVNQLTDVQGELLAFSRPGGAWQFEQLETPPMGAVSVVARSDDHDRFFYTFTSFTTPTTLHAVNDVGISTPVRALPAEFDATGMITEQHFATSRDGTRVPYFVVRRADAPMNGTNPTLLSAYGGFQISNTPRYLGSMGKGWVEDGGVFVLANIRGGGEYGPAWWKAALKENRQRAFDDFIAVSEDLIARGITSPPHLGIEGGSNGGLLVGVAMTQRPELYNAVVVAVPLLDMMRYHQLLAGASWMAEYGDPSIPAEREYIRAYSPYQNVNPNTDYPEPFIWTTTRDDRVHPGHARKLAALLESLDKPVRYFENTEGGHGSGVTPAQRAEIQALTMSYLWEKLGAKPVP